MQKRIKKIIFSFLTAILFVFYFATSATAQNSCNLLSTDQRDPSKLGFSIGNSCAHANYTVSVVSSDGAHTYGTNTVVPTNGAASDSVSLSGVTSGQSAEVILKDSSGNQIDTLTVQFGSGNSNPIPPSSPGPWYNQNFGQWSTKVFDSSNANEIFGERYTYAQVNWVLNSITAIIIGSDLTNCISKLNGGDMSGVGTCMKNLNVNPSNFNGMGPGGTITGLASLTNSLLNARPASGISYVRETAARLHIVPQAYAQSGVGYSTLSPVQTVWGVVRDISYALAVVVIIVMAFMIMFRIKISPQVVVTVQSALPRVVIALVLITFSYAIAGFIVDLMYVIVGAFAVMIKLAGGAIVATPGMVGQPNGVNPLDTIGLFKQLISGNGLWSIVVTMLVLTIILLIIGAVLFFAGATSSITLVGAIVGVPLLLGALLILVFAVIVLFVMLRLFWLMAKTGAITVLLIIVGPLMILMGVFSTTTGFVSWIKTIASNLVVYPTVIVLVFLSHYFFWGWFLGGASAVAPIFPYLNTFGINWATTGPGVVNLPGMPIGTNVIGLILAFVILFLIPKAAEIIQGLINGKGFNAGAGIREAVAPVTAPVASYLEGHSRAHPGSITGALTGVGASILKGR